MAKAGSKSGRFEEALRVRLERDLAEALAAEARRRGMTVAELVRRELRRAVVEHAAVAGREALDAALRRALRPTEERLANLAARAAMESSTAMLILVEYLGTSGKSDVIAVYQKARKRAAERLREPLPEPEPEEPGEDEGVEEA